MTSPADIATKFDTAIAAFTPIVGNPTDDDLRNVRQVLLQLCLSINLAGSTAGKVTGLILVDGVYRTQQGVTASFVEDQNPLDEYDPSINESTAAWQQQKLTSLWRSRLDNQARIAATKHGCRQLILHAFDEVVYVTLKSEETFYELVDPLTILAHIATNIGGLEVTDVVALLLELPAYWATDPRVPQYVMRMEDAQRKATRADLPISDAWLAAFATSSLFQANSFPNDRLTWDGKAKAAQTWTAWKAFFEPLQRSLERETRVAR